MRRKLNYFILLLLPALVLAQRRSPERSLSDRATLLNTDQQIALYQKQTAAQPSNPHLQNLLASAYIQKVRESTDFTYLDRASKIVDGVLIGFDAKISAKARIESPSSIGAGSVVEDGAQISSSILWDGVRVGPDTRIEDAVLGSGVVVEPGSIVRGGEFGKGTRIAAL